MDHRPTKTISSASSGCLESIEWQKTWVDCNHALDWLQVVKTVHVPACCPFPQPHCPFAPSHLHRLRITVALFYSMLSLCNLGCSMGASCCCVLFVSEFTWIMNAGFMCGDFIRLFIRVYPFCSLSFQVFCLMDCWHDVTEVVIVCVQVCPKVTCGYLEKLLWNLADFLTWWMAWSEFVGHKVV